MYSHGLDRYSESSSAAVFMALFQCALYGGHALTHVSPLLGADTQIQPVRSDAAPLQAPHAPHRVRREQIILASRMSVPVTAVCLHFMDALGPQASKSLAPLPAHFLTYPLLCCAVQERLCWPNPVVAHLLQADAALDPLPGPPHSLVSEPLRHRRGLGGPQGMAHLGATAA